MWRSLLALVVMVGMASAPARAVLAAELAGVWLTANSESQIEIAPCDNAYCGRILQVLKPSDPNGPTTDVKNPDPALRGRPIIGLTILSGLKPSGDPNVWEGSVYNPQDGGTYDVTLTLKGDVLEVEGCMAFVLCDSQNWTRVQSPQSLQPQSLQPLTLPPQY